jgi:hypothetical protein
MNKEAVQPGGFFADGSTLWPEDSFGFPQGLVANGCSTYQQLEFRRKSSDISNNIS